MDVCVICQNSFEKDSDVVTLRQKGVQGVIDASKERGDHLTVSAGQRIHQQCRKRYCNKLSITSDKKPTPQCGSKRSLRSQTEQFLYREHCFFCGRSANVKEKKHHRSFSVKTFDFQIKIESVCQERGPNDEWANDVKARLALVSDLHAADAVYHQACSVNFRTHKQIPQCFTDESTSKRTPGRPEDESQASAFIEVAKYLKENDDIQVTLSTLVDKMKEFCPVPYSTVYMRRKLEDHFGDSIVITEVNGKPNVVTFTNTVWSILQEFYKRPQHQNSESEKLSIINAAAKLIKSDIKLIEASSTTYPSPRSISSADQNLEYIPESLNLLLRMIMPENENTLKLASIGQTIVQAARPRILMAPLQVALGIQMHHHFGSRFLIDTLNKLGFCSSYSEVQRYEASAAVCQGIHMPTVETDHFIQYSADNVDHNIRTLDGHGSFHGMGIIASTTPSIVEGRSVERLSATAKELMALGTINIFYYTRKQCPLPDLTFKEIRAMKCDDPTWKLDLLWKIMRPIRSPIPGWSGMMQMVQRGDYPGKSSVFFFPMIDMNPSDNSCIYSTLKFVCDEASRHKTKAILTFDQPLYWKALMIVLNEPDESVLKTIVLRLGGFHLQMSFLGCIGHLMASSGLRELLETIYASNTVNHMLTGKAVARAVRGHSLVDNALNYMLVSKVMEKNVNRHQVETDVRAKEGVEVSVVQRRIDENDGQPTDGEDAEVDEDQEPRSPEPPVYDSDKELLPSTSGPYDWQEGDEVSFVQRGLVENVSEPANDETAEMEKDQRQDPRPPADGEDAEVDVQEPRLPEPPVYDSDEELLSSKSGLYDWQDGDEGSFVQRVLVENVSEPANDETAEMEKDQRQDPRPPEPPTCEYDEELISSVSDLYDELIARTTSPQAICDSTVLDDINRKLEKEKQSRSHLRTGSLWMQYMYMVDLLHSFIKAERTGNWDLHLKTVKDMLPFFAAAGHNLYLKSAYIYLQLMLQLETDHPDVYAAFQSGYHVIRRSNRYWAGLSSDLVIEQALMRSVKTTGGLTRGRGMTDAERARWILSMPACADMNNAMQEICGIDFHTSSQHKESSEARKERDHKDVFTLISFLQNRDPFAADPSLRNIETGVIADKNVNVDKSMAIGDNVVQGMIGEMVTEFSFKRSSQAVTMNAKTAIKVDGDSFQVDPQLLFQRLLLASNGVYEDKSEIFRYELCSQPSSLFDSSGLMRASNKASLAEAIWGLGECNTQELPSVALQFVLDGGSLLQRLPWRQGESFSSICKMYVNYVRNKFGDAIIVFDGYTKSSSTKDTAHIKRKKGVVGSTVKFTEDMPCRSRKDIFLANSSNKQRLLNMIGQKMEESGCTVFHADDDADLLIVQTAVECAKKKTTVIIGEDTDLLVLLCFHADATTHNIFFMSEKSKKQKIWDIQKTKEVLGEDVCKHLLFVHAISGCDTTSHPFGISKAAVLRKMMNDANFKRQSEIFIMRSSKEEVIKAGEEALISLYGGTKSEQLNDLRARQFFNKVASNKTSVKIQSLPPTSAAASYHSLRVFLQVQQWTGSAEDLLPQQWGWHTADNNLMPFKTHMQPAPEMLLKVIRCKCKTNCDSKRCTCRKHGLECSAGCSECRGISCTNVADCDADSDDDM